MENKMWCSKEEKSTKHTKQKDLTYKCNICGYSNGVRYSSLGCDSR